MTRCLILLAALVCVPAAPAAAGTLRYYPAIKGTYPENCTGKCPGAVVVDTPASLYYDAAPGEANDITVHRTTVTTIHDAAGTTLHPGTEARCTLTDPQTATCDLPLDSLNAGDGDDRVAVDGTVPVAGGSGNDDLTGARLSGGAGDDVLHGTPGDDRFFGGDGADVVDGGPGRDVADYTAMPSGVTVSLDGGPGKDRLIGIEALNGSPFADRLTGSAAADTIDGGGGGDLIDAGGGSDTISRANATSAVRCGDGDDVVLADLEATVLRGTDCERAAGTAPEARLTRARDLRVPLACPPALDPASSCAVTVRVATRGGRTLARRVVTLPAPQRATTARLVLPAATRRALRRGRTLRGTLTLTRVITGDGAPLTESGRRMLRVSG